MSLKDYKISDDAVQNVYVQSQPDILNGTTQENKAVFDKYPALIKDRFNDVLEILGGDSAASEMLIQAIEGLTAGNVQQALAELKRLLDAYIAKIKSTAGAAEVGVSAISGMSVSNTQQALAELKRLIDNLVIGTLPPGSVTANMIEDGAIVQLGALLAVAAAAAYDPAGSYAVGDYCTYQGLLYKCNTAIPSGEPWTAEHWTEMTVAAELAEVRASLSNKQDLIWLGIAEMDADLNDLKQIGTTAIHGTSKNVPPDVIPGNWGLLTVSANSKNGQVGCTQHLSIMATEGYFPQIYERNWNGLNWSKWARIATATPPQEYDLPLADGISDYATSVYHKNQFGEVSVRVSVSVTNTIQNGATIATLPEGFRPAKAIDTDATGYVSGSSWFACRLVIQPSGAVQVYWGIGSSTATFIVGSFELYLAAN